VGGDRRGLRKSCAATSRLLSPGATKVCDLQLLLGQLVPGVGDATTRRLAARAQFDACPPTAAACM
jgi:hypothetical protein